MKTTQRCSFRLLQVSACRRFIRLLLPPAGETTLQQLCTLTPPPHTDVQYKWTYYRKIVRSQCTLTYDKQSNISKEANHIYQKTQDTLVHQISKNCIHPLIFFVHMWNEKNVDKIQKQHSERVSPASSRVISEAVTGSYGWSLWK